MKLNRNISKKPGISPKITGKNREKTGNLDPGFQYTPCYSIQYASERKVIEIKVVPLHPRMCPSNSEIFGRSLIVSLIGH